MTAITFSLDNLTTDDRIPLYCQYAGQMQPQLAFVRMSEDGTVSADHLDDVGNSYCTPNEFSDVTLTWRVSPSAKGDRLAALLQGKALPLLEAIHAGHAVKWDGCNFHGKLNARAEAASNALRELLEETFEGDTSNSISFWDIDEWLFSSNNLRHHWSGCPLADAVAHIEDEIERVSEDNYVAGDAEAALLSQANYEFDIDGADDLDDYHIAALVTAGLITQADADARARARASAAN